MVRPRSLLMVATAGAALAGGALRPDTACAGDARADDARGPAAGDPGYEVFFRDPDRDTAARIKELIGQFSADSVLARRAARATLEDMGFWSVDPLVAALAGAEPPIRCSSALTLDAIGDPRALEPLRQAVAREGSHPLTGGFAALALGRFRDASSIPVFRDALRNPKNVDMLRAAVPLALARIRTPEALDLLRAQIAEPGGKEPVTSARFLALGFFPEAALEPAVPVRPSAPLAAAIAKSRRRGERQAALLAFLVATARRRDGKEYLLEVLATEEAPDVVRVGLVGLSGFEGADVTDRLTRIAAGSAPDPVRELACDLLVPRADPTAKPALMKIVASPQSARLRGSAVLALARIDDADARKTLLERLKDNAPLVRAAAALGATWSADAALREEAHRRIDGRLRAGETDSGARQVFQIARAVLSGDRTDVAWPEVGPEALFSEVALSHEQRLLRAVNLRAEASLDLAKIHNLQNDSEIKPSGPPSLPGSGGGDGDGGGGDGGDDGPGGPPGEDPGPAPDAPRGDMPLGAQRTSAWQELRDLKVELRRRPYFTRADLPGPPAAETGKR